ncbi:MAG: transcriptional regulator, partial [Pseudolabrys sp.]
MLFVFEDFVLDNERRELRAGGTIVPIEPQVFDLLVYLIENRDRVVSKDDLIASVWGGRIVSDSALDSRINAVRKALGDSGKEQRLIQTIARKGVRFLGEVTTSNSKEAQGPA